MHSLSNASVNSNIAVGTDGVQRQPPMENSNHPPRETPENPVKTSERVPKRSLSSERSIERPGPSRVPENDTNTVRESVASDNATESNDGSELENINTDAKRLMTLEAYIIKRGICLSISLKTREAALQENPAKPSTKALADTLDTISREEQQTIQKLLTHDNGSKRRSPLQVIDLRRRKEKSVFSVGTWKRGALVMLLGQKAGGELASHDPDETHTSTGKEPDTNEKIQASVSNYMVYRIFPRKQMLGRETIDVWSDATFVKGHLQQEELSAHVKNLKQGLSLLSKIKSLNEQQHRRVMEVVEECRDEVEDEELTYTLAQLELHHDSAKIRLWHQRSKPATSISVYIVGYPTVERRVVSTSRKKDYALDDESASSKAVLSFHGEREEVEATTPRKERHRQEEYRKRDRDTRAVRSRSLHRRKAFGDESVERSQESVTQSFRDDSESPTNLEATGEEREMVEELLKKWTPAAEYYDFRPRPRPTSLVRDSYGDPERMYTR
jgi:hypothetical protein